MTIPAGNTGLEPTKTSFFQTLNINTKITKGTVEILKDEPVIKAGDRVLFVASDPAVNYFIFNCNYILLLFPPGWFIRSNFVGNVGNQAIFLRNGNC